MEGTTGDRLDTYREHVLGILARVRAEGEDGISEGQIGKELGLDATQVSEILRRLQHDGLAGRTAGGDYFIEPGAASKTEPRPSPSEPTQEREQ